MGLAPASESRENFTARNPRFGVVLSFCDARVPGREAGEDLWRPPEKKLCRTGRRCQEAGLLSVFLKQTFLAARVLDSPIPGSFTSFAIPESVHCRHFRRALVAWKADSFIYLKTNTLLMSLLIHFKPK